MVHQINIVLLPLSPFIHINIINNANITIIYSTIYSTIYTYCYKEIFMQSSKKMSFSLKKYLFL